MTRRLACPPAPGRLEDYAARFDDLFETLAQRRSFRAYLQGLLLPRERNKTLWHLTTNLPHPVRGDLAEVLRLYGLRQWVEQSHRQVKHELG